MLAVITGLLDLIPQIGATIAAVILVAVALTVGLAAAVGMLVDPARSTSRSRTTSSTRSSTGERSSCPPFTTIVAVLIAGSILGVVGAILAVPFAAVIKVVVREAGRPRRERMATLRAATERDEVPV